MKKNVKLLLRHMPFLVPSYMHIVLDKYIHMGNKPKVHQHLICNKKVNYFIYLIYFN